MTKPGRAATNVHLGLYFSRHELLPRHNPRIVKVQACAESRFQNLCRPIWIRFPRNGLSWHGIYFIVLDTNRKLSNEKGVGASLGDRSDGETLSLEYYFSVTNVLFNLMQGYIRHFTVFMETETEEVGDRLYLSFLRTFVPDATQKVESRRAML